jgi:hypothetical protein
MARLGDQRLIRRCGIVVRGAGGDFVGIRAREAIDGIALRVAGSPVCSLMLGTSICHWLAIAFTSFSV